MEVAKTEVEFRPIALQLESQEEVDQLCVMLGALLGATSRAWPPDVTNRWESVFRALRALASPGMGGWGSDLNKCL